LVVELVLLPLALLVQPQLQVQRVQLVQRVLQGLQGLQVPQGQPRQGELGPLAQRRQLGLVGQQRVVIRSELFVNLNQLRKGISKCVGEYVYDCVGGH